MLNKRITRNTVSLYVENFAGSISHSVDVNLGTKTLTGPPGLRVLGTAAALDAVRRRRLWVACH